MLNYLIPQGASLNHHPIYWIEQRRISWKRALPRIPRYSLFWSLRVFLVVLALWLITVGDAYLNQPINSSGFSSFRYSLIDRSFTFIGWAGLAALALVVLLDFISVLVSVNGIVKDKYNEHWNLIHLTTLNQRGIIAAKHTLAQVRAWRITMIVVAARLSVLLIFGLHLLLIPDPYSDQTAIQSLLQNFVDNFFTSLVFLLGFALFSFLYIIEPLWRMRLITAMGTAISAWVRSATMGGLAGLAAVAFMWISHGLIIAAFLFVSNLIGQWLFTFNDVSAELTAVIIYIWIVAFFGIVYFYYRLLCRWSLRRAEKAAFRLD